MHLFSMISDGAGTVLALGTQEEPLRRLLFNQDRCAVQGW